MAKVYQEERGSTFESNGVFYDLNGILKDARHLPVNNIATSRLMWAIPKDLDTKRVEAADETIPVLVTLDKGRPLVVDGAHRTLKRYRLMLTPKSKFSATTPYRLVSHEIMKRHILSAVKK